MKYFKNTLIATLIFSAVLLMPSFASAQGTWKVDIAAPNQTINSRKFNIEFTTLSTSSSDTISVDLYQNGVVVDSESTTKPYGDSGDFIVTVPSDGTYEFFVRGTNGAEVKDSAKKVVKVDTVATSSPVYGQVVRDGNTYTVTFVAPGNSDVVEVRLYSSTATNFTANAQTQVGRVFVAPGQQASISYTAADSAQRYHAVQAFDGAGNGSVPVGESNVIVSQGAGLPGENNSSDVQGASQGGSQAQSGSNDGVSQSSNPDDQGVVNADGSSKDDGTKGEVSGDSDTNDSKIAWIIILGVLALALIYANREKIAKLFKKDK